MYPLLVCWYLVRSARPYKAASLAIYFEFRRMQASWKDECAGTKYILPTSMYIPYIEVSIQDPYGTQEFGSRNIPRLRAYPSNYHAELQFPEKPFCVWPVKSTKLGFGGGRRD
jgi:hypothetical protein